MARYLYSELSQAIQARKNCEDSGNDVWFERWSERIDQMVKELPSGSGFDNGTQIDLDASHTEKLVFYTSFHHMTEGYYDGWTEHTVTVTPSFAYGVNIRVSGRDREDIKEYIVEQFDYALKLQVQFDGNGKLEVIRG